MGFPSQTGQVGFRTQAVKGTFVNPGTTLLGKFMRLRSGGLGIDRELIIPDPEIGGNRDVPDAYLGPAAYSGEYSFYTRLESAATLLKAVLGAGSSSVAGSGSTQVGTHTITPANTIPWLSIEEAVGSTYDCFNYTDSKVNTFHLEAEAKGYLMGTAGLIALTQTAGITRTAVPEYDTTPMIVGTNIVVTFNSVDLKAKSFSLDINNNIESDDFRLGSLTLGDAVEKRREVTAGVVIRPDDNILFRQAAYGAQAATTPQGGAVFKAPLNINCTTYEVIGTSSTVYTLTIAIPSASVKPFKPEPSGDDVLQLSLDIQALRPNPGTNLCTVTVKNALATIL